MEIKVRAHTCYIGRTGFAAHARGFFRNLSSHVDLRVRNYTWDDTPETHLVDKDYQIIDLITLNTTAGSELDEGMGGKYKDFTLQHVSSWKHLPFKDFSKEPEFVPDIDIVLMDTNHYYFYEKPDPRIKIRIAYLVYETTLLEEKFYKTVLENFTHIFVPTKWHKEMMIEQGCEPSRILVVPEGIDEEFHNGNTTKDLEEYSDERFKFLFFGRWDYRKAVPEILKSFLEEFKEEEPVDFILSADNLFSIDGMSTTEERLEFYGLSDSRIKIKHFPSREDYVNYIKTGHVLVTCARSEGWNIPLAEAIAAGTPVIYSNYGAQLEFAEGIGTPVSYTEMRKAELGSGKSWFQGYLPGDYCEPDYVDLKRALRETYENWEEKKAESLEAAHRIRSEFSWERIGEIGYQTITNLMVDMLKTHMEDIEMVSLLDLSEETEVISFHFVSGPYVEITSKKKNQEYFVEFIDAACNCPVYSGTIKSNHWIGCNREYYVDWIIRVTDLKKKTVIFEHKFNLEGKRVFISMESSSLGDNIAWFAPIEEFQKKHKCSIIVSTFKNDLFRSEYPSMQFVERGVGVQDIYAAYKIGWFYEGDSMKFNSNMHSRHFIDIPMQDSASDILGIENKQYRPRIVKNLKDRPVKGKYVCIGIHATAQPKYWNHSQGWQKVVDYLKSEGYEVILISKESGTYMENQPPTGIIDKSGDIPLSDRINNIAHAEAFIGVGSGLSWLAWAVGTKVVMISGFSKPYSEFNGEDVLRISNQQVCNGCFNRERLDAGDWNWCPDHKNTPKQFECTKKIEPETVIEKIKKFITNG